MEEWKKKQETKRGRVIYGVAHLPARELDSRVYCVLDPLERCAFKKRGEKQLS